MVLDVPIYDARTSGLRSAWMLVDPESKYSPNDMTAERSTEGPR